MRLQALDGWRTICVFMVIAGHLAAFSNIALSPLEPVLSAAAALGVQCFFVISGLVIAKGLVAEFDRTGTVSFAGFYVRRFLRIVPPLAIYLATVLWLARTGILPADAFKAVRAATFTCNWPTADCGWFGAHTWSLGVEEQFYIGAPLIIAMIGQRRRIWIAAVLAIPVAVFGLFVFRLGDAARLIEPFDFIAVGVACGLFEREVMTAARRIPLAALPVGAVVLAVIVLLPPVPATTAIKVIFTAPLIAALLLHSQARHTRWSAFLTTWPMQQLGLASYGIYLWQQLATAPYPGAGPVFYALSVAGCIVLALFLRRTIEEPSIALGRSLTRDRLLREVP